jgi:hypothetical protein
MLKSTRWIVGIASCLAFAVGTWLISPRFSIGGPSLIDDWAAEARSPHQIGSFARLFSVYAARFRPGWIGWNYVQWHTLGAPAHMLGPNAWGILRLLVFIGGVSLLTILLLPAEREPGWRARVWAVALLTPLLVLTTPKIGVDFARFGPQEPLQVGCMALGAALLILGLRALVATGSPHRSRTACYLVTGSALWVLGVYQKESSVAVLAFVPFLYWPHRERIRRLMHELDRGRFIALGAVVAAVLLPLVHVAVEVALIAERGPLVYGAQVSSGGGVARKTSDFITGMSSNTGSRIGLVLLAALAAGVAASALRRRPDWLLSGLLATALVFLAWSAQTGQSAGRYYIPSLTLTAIGLSIMLARLHQRSASVALAAVAVLVGVTAEQFRFWSARPGPALSHPAILVLVLVVVGVGVALLKRGRSPAGLAFAAVLVLVCGSALETHRLVDRWAEDDEAGWQLVEAVSSARESGCRVAARGLDLERASALPVLVALQPARSRRVACESRALLVLGPGAGRTAAIACRPGRRTTLSERVLQGEPVRLVSCRASETPEAARLFARGLG